MFIPRDALIPNCVDVELMVAGPDTVRTPRAGQNNGPDGGVIGLGQKLLPPIHSGPEKRQYLDKGVCCALGGRGVKKGGTSGLQRPKRRVRKDGGQWQNDGVHIQTVVEGRIMP